MEAKKEKKLKPWPRKWNQLYGQKVWSKCSDHWWPSLVYDPETLTKVNKKLKEKSISLVGTKHTIRYFGMTESTAYGFIPLKDLRPYDGDDDLFYQQDANKISHNRKEFLEGLKLMQLEETEDCNFFTSVFESGYEAEVDVVDASRNIKKHSNAKGKTTSSSSSSRRTDPDRSNCAYIMVDCIENKYFGKRLIRYFPESSGEMRPYEGRVTGYLPEEKITDWYSYSPMYHIFYSEDGDEEDLSERSLKEAIHRFDAQPGLMQSFRQSKLSSSSEVLTKAVTAPAPSQSGIVGKSNNSLLLTADEMDEVFYVDKKPRLDTDLWSLDDYQDLDSTLPGQAHSRNSSSPAAEIAVISTELCTLEAEHAQLQERLSANLENQKKIKAKLRWLTLNSFTE